MKAVMVETIEKKIKREIYLYWLLYNSKDKSLGFLSSYNKIKYHSISK